eukprot:CAMPEP_0114545616 /NCGR_PEP_ID=MMETSP0114-20121206/3503_1 /TAXON_ID=31324 /ORGANISM="Goniomonas sp, Strain m" /LENGTH=80 /DNA_ID=CAMNT_0001730071 /DNA_START=10 /DNA_END=249 /DNA_ORIENTATION=-
MTPGRSAELMTPGRSADGMTPGRSAELKKFPTGADRTAPTEAFARGDDDGSSGTLIRTLSDLGPRAGRDAVSKKFPTGAD